MVGDMMRDATPIQAAVLRDVLGKREWFDSWEDLEGRTVRALLLIGWLFVTGDTPEYTSVEITKRGLLALRLHDTIKLVAHAYPCSPT